MKRIRIIAICFLTGLVANSAVAAIYRVPEEYDTIQAAVDACGDFDTVVIARGTHRGFGNRDINLNGKAVTVRSTDPTDPCIVNTTVIDCEGKGRGFVFKMAEDADSKVAGLTITNGYCMVGGAIYSYNDSSPSITNCVIRNNSAVFGGGIACANGESHPVITNCQIIANSALFGGGAVYLNGSSPIIKNSIISGNFAAEGGAICSLYPGNPLVANCTISANAADNSAGAVYCYNAGNLSLNNCILWDDAAPYASEVLVGNLGDPASIHISYCNIQGGEQNVKIADGCTVEWGDGIIDIDPQFVDAGSVEGDYHLLEESPCIDTGDPAFTPAPGETDIDGNPRILGAKIDLGADEYKPPIPATVRITPRVLNLASKGNPISCTIRLPDGYDIADVDITSITVNRKAIKLAWSRTDEVAQKLFIKFERSEIPEIQKMLSDAQGSVLLIIRGKLNDDQDFKGGDTIRIVRAGGKK